MLLTSEMLVSTCSEKGRFGNIDDIGISDEINIVNQQIESPNDQVYRTLNLLVVGAGRSGGNPFASRIAFVASKKV